MKKKYTSQDSIEVITGLNLPMLVQAITNRDGSLSQTVRKCMQSAQESIIKMNNK